MLRALFNLPLLHSGGETISATETKALEGRPLARAPSVWKGRAGTDLGGFSREAWFWPVLTQREQLVKPCTARAKGEGNPRGRGLTKAGWWGRVFFPWHLCFRLLQEALELFYLFPPGDGAWSGSFGKGEAPRLTRAVCPSLCPPHLLRAPGPDSSHCIPGSSQ